MIGLLRFVGLINAAVWFGAALFAALAAGSAVSPEMRELLGFRNFPYFSIAIGQMLLARYFHVYLICSFVALLHVAAEWLYLGKYPHRLWLTFILILVLIGIVQTYWLQPRLRTWHRLRYSEQTQSQAADRAFRFGQSLSEMLHIVVIAGLAIYVWRIAYPQNSTRFVSATKFRS